MSQRPTAEQLIAHYNLEPLQPEGGYFRRYYLSNVHTASPQARPAGSAIFVMYTAEANSFAALHRLPTDEIYHFYYGDPVMLLLLYPDGKTERVTLGGDILTGKVAQVVPAGVWQGAFLRPRGDYALLGTTMAPAFMPLDYEGGERAALIDAYPHEADLIRRLTRPGSPLTMDAD